MCISSHQNIWNGRRLTHKFQILYLNASGSHVLSRSKSIFHGVFGMIIIINRSKYFLLLFVVDLVIIFIGVEQKCWPIFTVWQYNQIKFLDFVQYSIVILQECQRVSSIVKQFYICTSSFYFSFNAHYKMYLFGLFSAINQC